MFIVTQLCLTLCNLMDCSPSISSVHGFPGKNTGVGCHFLLQGIFLTQELNLSLSCISCIGGGFFTTEPPGKLLHMGSNPDQQDQGSDPWHLHWKCGVLTTGLPQKSCSCCFELLPFLWKTRSDHICAGSDFSNNPSLCSWSKGSCGCEHRLAYVIQGLHT